MPKILILKRQDTAVGYYRQELPARALKALGYAVTLEDVPGGPLKESLSPWLKERLGKFDIVIVDRGVTMAEVLGDPNEDILGYRFLVHGTPGCRMICDFDDDFLSIPRDNKSWEAYQPGMEARNAGFSHLRLSELTTVSTQPLVDRFKRHTHAIQVAPNHIDPVDWNGFQTNPRRSKDERVRILYGGAYGHFGDLNAVRGGLERVLRNPPVPLRLIAFGAMPSWMHDIRRAHPDRLVNIPWVRFKGTPSYAATVAWGGFDLAIAPLAANPFNETKSNIKALEAGLQGIPFIASRIGPYASIPEDAAILLENSPSDWYDAFKEILTSLPQRIDRALRLKEWALDNYHSDKLQPIWKDIIEATMARPLIQTYEDTVVPSMLSDPATAVK